MQRRGRIFDDLAKVAGGAASTLSGVKAEIEGLIRQQIERLLVNADMVPRDEFDAVKAVAAKARSEQEALEIRVRAVERKLGLKPPAREKKKVKPKTKAKPAKTKKSKKAKPKTKAMGAKTKKPSRKTGKNT